MALVLVGLLAGCQPREEWELLWSDEFEGGAIDRSNWTYDRGGLGWGDNELQAYTDRPDNESGAIHVRPDESDPIVLYAGLSTPGALRSRDLECLARRSHTAAMARFGDGAAGA